MKRSTLKIHYFFASINKKRQDISCRFIESIIKLLIKYHRKVTRKRIDIRVCLALLLLEECGIIRLNSYIINFKAERYILKSVVSSKLILSSFKPAPLVGISCIVFLLLGLVVNVSLVRSFDESA